MSKRGQDIRYIATISFLEEDMSAKLMEAFVTHVEMQILDWVRDNGVLTRRRIAQTLIALRSITSGFQRHERHVLGANLEGASRACAQKQSFWTPNHF
jgi:hypothetical protein